MKFVEVSYEHGIGDTLKLEWPFVRSNGESLPVRLARQFTEASTHDAERWREGRSNASQWVFVRDIFFFRNGKRLHMAENEKKGEVEIIHSISWKKLKFVDFCCCEKQTTMFLSRSVRVNDAVLATAFSSFNVYKILHMELP